MRKTLRKSVRVHLGHRSRYRRPSDSFVLRYHAYCKRGESHHWHNPWPYLFLAFSLWSLGLAPRPWQASWLPLLCPLTHFVMLFMPSDTSHVNPDWNMSSLLWHLQNSITTMSSSTGASNLLWRGKNQEVFLLSVSRVTCTGVGSRWVDFVLFHSLLSIESNFESTACWKKGKVSWSPRIHTHMFIRYVY